LVQSVRMEVRYQSLIGALKLEVHLCMNSAWGTIFSQMISLTRDGILRLLFFSYQAIKSEHLYIREHRVSFIFLQWRETRKIWISWTFWECKSFCEKVCLFLEKRPKPCSCCNNLFLVAKLLKQKLCVGSDFLSLVVKLHINFWSLQNVKNITFLQWEKVDVQFHYQQQKIGQVVSLPTHNFCSNSLATYNK